MSDHITVYFIAKWILLSKMAARCSHTITHNEALEVRRFRVFNAGNYRLQTHNSQTRKTILHHV